jgi:hypothetical protein
MSVIIQGYQLREIAFGVQVIKKAQTPPNSGSSATLYTVTGGVVLVTSLIGRVTTVLSGTTGKIALGSKPASGSGTEETAGIGTATVVGGAEVGTMFTTLSASGVAGALTGNLLAGNVPFLPAPFAVNSGTIEVTTSIATMTGAIDWYLTYVPLDTGAAVA